MMLRDELIRFIAREQQADGSFLSWSAPAGGSFDGAKPYTTTFMTATIALAIADIRDPRLERVREKAVDWLLQQAGPQWSFNYWGRSVKEAVSQPYPDDWDDTSCALAAIMRIRPRAITGEVVAEVVALLTNTETQEGGPYRTWLVGSEADEHWQDVDVAVNSNIAYLLSLHDVRLPSLEALVETAIREQRLRSPYYPDDYTVTYFLSRWYRGEGREALARRVLGGKGDWLQMALAVTAALNLGSEAKTVEAKVARLRKAKVAELTRPYAFCFDPAIEGQPYVAGSGALTAAMCLEALRSYDEAARPAGFGVDEARERIHGLVVKRVMARFEELPEAIGQSAGHMRERVLKDDPARQITLLPYLFRQAMGKAGAGISKERLVELGAASLYGWLAYTIYDDFLDNEGHPAMLPLANIALRELVLALEHDEAGGGFTVLAWQTMDRMEAANAWEVSHCRFDGQRALLSVAPPDYGDLTALADRSLGHALGCLSMMAEAGYGPESPESRAVERFFHHFLIARQLNDEAHDWEDDLKNGHINAVGALLLSATPRRGRSVAGYYERLRNYFWEAGIVTVCERVFTELAAARQALGEGGLEHPKQLELLLAPIERATTEAMDKQRQTLEFLRTYKQKLH